MNFVGHVAIAVMAAPVDPGSGPAPEGYLIGAALPDLAAMGRFRLLDRPADVDVSAGIDLHHRTDDVFHRHPWFRTHSAAVSATLQSAGLSRGAARACGHVGIELLLDGHLLVERVGLRQAVDSAIAGAGRRIDELEPLVAEPQRPGWRHHLDRLAGWDVPADYQHPTAVAARLQRIVSRRPRLAFPPDQTSLVAAALAEQHQQLVDEAPDLLDDLTAELVTSR